MPDLNFFVSNIKNAGRHHGDLRFFLNVLGMSHQIRHTIISNEL